MTLCNSIDTLSAPATHVIMYISTMLLIILKTQIKIKNVARCRDSRSAKSRKIR